MQMIPPPDEVSATFSRFQVLKDSELEDMRSFLNEHKKIMQIQYSDFTNEKKSFDDLNHRMEADKEKISLEREKVEAEVLQIRELTKQLEQQMRQNLVK